jgi:DNA primase
MFFNMNEQQFNEEAKKGFNDAPKMNTGFIHGIDIRNSEHLLFACPMEQLGFEIMGGVNMKQMDRLRVTLKVARNPLLSPVHVFRNTVDLYNDNQIKRYVRDAAEKLEIGTTDLTRTVYQLIDGVEKYRLQHRKEQLVPQRAPRIELAPAQKTKAKKLLKSKDLLNEVSDLLAQAGLVGEAENGLLLFLIFLTRQFESPLHGLIHGSSGSGKTNLLKTVIKCVPDEQKHITTALTENVLFYPPYKEFWKHKVLMLEDLDGSMSALYSLREFMSNGHIVKFTTEMDSNSGEHKQKKLEAKGPVCIVGATTKEKIYEDNSNRSYLIHIDESYQHQQAVMMYQNQIAAGLIDQVKQEEVAELLRNAQRLLEPLEIRNPFQPELMLPQVVFKPLRTNQHYIALIKSITYLHQFQLEIQQDKRGRYIETKLDHIEWANKLCRESLLRKSDQLTGAQRVFFERLKKYLKAEKKESFYTKEICSEFRLFRTQVKRNMTALENVSLVSLISSNVKMSFEYKIDVWDDYSDLQSGIDILDEKLKELRDKYPGA